MGFFAESFKAKIVEEKASHTPETRHYPELHTFSNNV